MIRLGRLNRLTEEGFDRSHTTLELLESESGSDTLPERHNVINWPARQMLDQPELSLCETGDGFGELADLVGMVPVAGDLRRLLALLKIMSARVRFIVSPPRCMLASPFRLEPKMPVPPSQSRVTGG